MEWELFKNSRNLPLEKMADIEIEFKNKLGNNIFALLAKDENKEHPWHNCSKSIKRSRILDPNKKSIKRMFSQAAQFLYFYNMKYNNGEKVQSISRIKSKKYAESLLFELLIGMNYEWSNFYKVEPTNIFGSNNDFILRKGRIKIGVECGIKIKSVDFRQLLRKVERKASQLKKHGAPLPPKAGVGYIRIQENACLIIYPIICYQRLRKR